MEGSIKNNRDKMSFDSSESLQLLDWEPCLISHCFRLDRTDRRF